MKPPIVPFSGGSSSFKTPAVSSDFSSTPVDSFTASKPKPKVGSGKALKLGGKTGTEAVFCEQLRQEGQQINEFGLNVRAESHIRGNLN